MVQRDVAYPCYLKYLIHLIIVGFTERNLSARNQLDPFSCFSTVLACDSESQTLVDS